MNAAEPRKLCILKTGDHSKDFALRAVFQFGLEADHVP